MTRPQLGRRGGALLCLGFLDLGYSWAVDASLTPQQKGVPGLLLPWQAWAALWLVAGALCLVYAFRFRDRVAFSFAAAIKFAWGGVSLYRWIIGKDHTGWVSALLWVSLSILVLIISSWPEEES